MNNRLRAAACKQSKQEQESTPYIIYNFYICARSLALCICISLGGPLALYSKPSLCVEFMAVPLNAAPPTSIRTHFLLVLVTQLLLQCKSVEQDFSNVNDYSSQSAAFVVINFGSGCFHVLPPIFLYDQYLHR